MYNQGLLRTAKNNLHLGHFKISKSIGEQSDKNCKSFCKLRGCQNLALSLLEARARREIMLFHFLMEVQLIHNVVRCKCTEK